MNVSGAGRVCILVQGNVLLHWHNDINYFCGLVTDCSSDAGLSPVVITGLRVYINISIILDDGFYLTPKAHWLPTDHRSLC